MHAHNHSEHHQPIDLKKINSRFIVGIILNALFVVLEFSVGFFSNSLALMSDAGHNLSDVASLILALGAFKLLKIKATSKFTYGYRKGTILISLLNAVILLIAVGVIGFESIQRLFAPEPVKSTLIIGVALAGIFINGASALLFFRDKDKDVNVRGAYLHLAVDALVSIGVVMSGVIIFYTQWTWVDPLISVVIMIVIVASTWNLLRDSLSLAIDAVPPNIDLESIRQAALKLPGLKDIHHIHVWAISTAENALTAHLVVNEPVSNEEIKKMKDEFKHALEHLGIQHATLETEFSGTAAEPCSSVAHHLQPDD